jgi:hypothetical protein
VKLDLFSTVHLLQQPFLDAATFFSTHKTTYFHLSNYLLLFSNQTLFVHFDEWQIMENERSK